MEDNILNLTSSAASGEADASVCSGTQILSPLIHEQYFGEIQKDITIIEENQPPPAKKRRNLPGNPDPYAEVIALSPKSLLETNRFLCEICNKGFQRDQNLQLHRRGHNLPWKLKQKTNDGIRKKVYICPVIGCVHHDPLRALGDLTGVKKHFFRKHGEKKWKCDKCSKKYAVQSDWKAHSKICGTREHICDCGTLFTRRDSFITHKAFCDALAKENARTTSTTLIPSNLPFLSPPRVTSTPLPHHQQIFNPFALMQQLPPWLSTDPFTPSSIFSSPSDLNDLTNPQSELETPDQNPSPNSNLVCYQPIAPLFEEKDSAHEGAADATVDPQSLLIQDLMNSLYYSSPYPYVASSFDDHTSTTFCDLTSSKNDRGLNFHEEGTTRDFLG